MALANGSFELAGATRGEASGWTFAQSVAAGALGFAAFDTIEVDRPTVGHEPFDWYAFVAAFSGFLVDLAPAFFDDDTVQAEDFNDLWGGTYASVDSLLGTFALAHLQTLNISINGGPTQVIVFDAADFYIISAAGAEEVARVIRAQLTDGSAILRESRVRITTDRSGVAGSVQVTGGTAAAALGFPGTLVTGSNRSGPLLQSVEYSFELFAGVEYETFQIGWEGGGTLDLTTDPDDLSGRISLGMFGLPVVDYDGFEDDWGGPTVVALSPTFATFTGTGTDETFAGTWTAMTTI